MSLRMGRRIGCAIVCFLILASCVAHCEQALILTGGNVYAAASATGKAIGTVSAGMVVALNGESGGWAQISRGGQTGYVDSSTLAPLQSYANAVATTQASAKLYKSWTEASSALATIDRGQTVAVLATAGAWARVTWQNQTGFVRLALLSTPVEQSVTAYVCANSAEVRALNGQTLAILSLGAEVTLLETRSNVSKVSFSGGTGYMRRSDLSLEKTSQVTATAAPADQSALTGVRYVSSATAKVYNQKGTVIGTLKKGSAVTVIRSNGTLALVSKNGRYGLMYLSDLTSVSPLESAMEGVDAATWYVSNETAAYYDASGQKVGTLSEGTAVTVTGQAGNVLRVIYESSVYYMKKADLSSQKSGTGGTLSYGDTGSLVTALQERLKELGWFAGTAGGNYLDLTRSAVSRFQAEAGLTATGVVDQATWTLLFSSDAPKYDESTQVVPSGSNAVPAKGIAIEMDWWTSDIQQIFARGTVATITDVDTGIAWKEMRRGGSNHADVQPCTAADTAAMKKACGGKWSWARRAIFVTIDGVNYAASMNCMNHGAGAIKNNNFDGHHCIHFTNSRTHGSNKVDPLHKAAIEKALAAVL